MTASGTDYTVRLDKVFHGPMDLLLHLVREQEVEIQEVELAKVLDGYLGYLKTLEELDIEYAGDFLVMAATLMAIKSRSLLPRDEVELDDDLDPRDELIQRLLEYKRYKGTAQDLEERWHERARLHARGYRGEAKEHREEPSIDLGELTTWDLLAAFSRLMRETRRDHAHHITVEARPLRFYVEHMAESIRAKGTFSLRVLVESFEDGFSRDALVGSFCALLELVKLGLVTIVQGGHQDDIRIELNPEHQGDFDEVLRSSRLEDEPEPEPEAEGEAQPGAETAEASSAAGEHPAP